VTETAEPFRFTFTFALALLVGSWTSTFVVSVRRQRERTLVSVFNVNVDVNDSAFWFFVNVVEPKGQAAGLRAVYGRVRPRSRSRVRRCEARFVHLRALRASLIRVRSRSLRL